MEAFDTGGEAREWERELLLHGASHPVAQPGVGILGRKRTRGEEPGTTFCSFTPNSYSRSWAATGTECSPLTLSDLILSKATLLHFEVEVP